MESELRLRDIAGFCPQEAVWKMMADVTAFIIKEGANGFLTPDSIIVDGKNFILDSKAEAVSEFLAPEHNGQNPDSKQIVWSLGALTYYLVTGHIIFGGHGGNYQKLHPSVPLPVLPKSYQELVPVTQKCLCYNGEERISLEELNKIALNGLTVCERAERNKLVSPVSDNKVIKNSGEKWPEEMIEI